MFLVPIFIRTLPNSQAIRQIWLFLERNGNYLMDLPVGEHEDPISAAKEFLETNDLVSAESPFQVGSLVFAPIHPDKCPDLTGFYTWSETSPGTTPVREAWRPFYWVSADTNDLLADSWGVNRMMEGICLADTPELTAYSVLKTYLGCLKDRHSLSLE